MLYQNEPAARPDRSPGPGAVQCPQLPGSHRGPLPGRHPCHLGPARRTAGVVPAPLDSPAHCGKRRAPRGTAVDDRHVHIFIRQKNGRVDIRISDRGHGFPEEILNRLQDPRDPGYPGLFNVQKRLHSVYGGQCDFTVNSSEQGSAVAISIPLIPPEGLKPKQEGSMVYIHKQDLPGLSEIRPGHLSLERERLCPPGPGFQRGAAHRPGPAQGPAGKPAYLNLQQSPEHFVTGRKESGMKICV